MKTNPELGKKIHEFLLEKGVETPLEHYANNDKNKFAMIETSIYKIMTVLGLDLENDSLKETPRRVATMYLHEVFKGLDYNNFPKCSAFKNTMKYDEMVLVDKINVQSHCEHHFVAIDGFAKVAYIPSGKVLGLSKLNRVVEFFSKRPQVQERLTEQIYWALSYVLQTENIAVQVKATHFCVKSRGIQDVNSLTTTNKLGGKFRERDVRNEFFNS